MKARTLQPIRPLARGQWLRLGVIAAVAAIVAVLIVQSVILTIWPDLSAFKPLDNLPRSAIFTLIPAALATALFAWLAARRPQADQNFLRIALIVLMLSFLPDYLIPDPAKSLLASTATALLHAVAAAVVVPVLAIGYRRATRGV
jgi:hypothetical protein